MRRTGGHFTLKTLGKSLPAEKCIHRFLALQKSGRYSEMRIVRQGRSQTRFGIVGYEFPTRKARRALNIGRRNPSKAAGATANQVRFGQHGKTLVGWIHHATPTRYQIVYKDGAHLRFVWRYKNKVQFVKTGRRGRIKKNPCPKKANPSRTTNPREVQAAARLSRLFHQLAPRYYKNVYVPFPKALSSLGGCSRVNYISDKYDGKPKEYTHAFEGPCKLYAGVKNGQQIPGLLIIKGKFKITEDGIEG